eukprot:8719848-Pyramimonas_sp.AAC.1
MSNSFQKPPSPTRGRRHRLRRDQHRRPHWPRLLQCENRHQHRHYQHRARSSRRLAVKCPLECAQRSAPPRPRRWRQTRWPLRARASVGAAAEMHQPTPSMHSQSPLHGFCKPSCGWVGEMIARAWDVSTHGSKSTP